MLRRALSIVLLSVAATAHAEPPRNPTPRPIIVVTMVIDQLAGWIANDRLAQLPADGGFARLRREGTYARQLVFAHAASDTAPGHAALFTGAPPRQSGIFANEVIDDETHDKISILTDPATHMLTSDGARAVPASSLRRLALPTLADALRAARPKATIVALSLKDRGALFGGGRHPTATLWYEASVGRFLTSTAVADDFPKWALPIVPPDFLRAMKEKSWSLDERELAFVRAHAVTGDDAPGEGEIAGEKTTFPHTLSTTEDPGRAFRATPFADDVLLQLALAAVDARDRNEPMLLAVSLSANDYIGHVYGPDSWESWDELLRLDGALARFFAALDERVGADGWGIVLSADHGVTTMPEAAPLLDARPWCKPGAPKDRFARACASAGRVLPEELLELLRRVAARLLGPGEWISGVADPYVYLTPQARALASARRRALDEALAFALRATPGVGAVFDAQHPPATCPRDDAPASLVCRALVPSSPGELYVMLQPGWFFDPDYVVGKGTSHGSPYLYDRAVPLFARAPGRVPRGRTVERPLAPAAFAHTAATLLGVAPPPGARDGVDLAAP